MLVAPIMSYYVYILASRTKRLYIGVTNSLQRRVGEHKSAEIEGFSKRYHINRLVYTEEWKRASEAIGREKQLKAWRRAKKVNLIEAENPEWDDLAEGW